jgi:large subunit ribosomal protein L24
VSKEASIHVSNVMVVDPTTEEPTRIGRKQVEENGKTRWVRYSKKSGELIDK